MYKYASAVTKTNKHMQVKQENSCNDQKLTKTKKSKLLMLSFN